MSTPRRQPIPWAPGVLLAVGFTAILLLAIGDAIRQRSGVDDARQLQALQEISGEIAISHLWLEEFVSGDAVDEAEITGRLDHALSLLDSMIGSGTTLATAPTLHTAELRRQAVALRLGLENFRGISEDRRLGFQRGLPVGIGSALDIEYDREFEALLSAGQRLREQLETHRLQHQARARRLLGWIVGGWSLLLVAASAVLWQREQRRRRAESELADSRRQLLQTQRMEVAGRMAGGLAHDLANYLAAIRGHCEWVQLKHPEPEKLDRKMLSVLRTVDRATGLVDRLLAFARRRAATTEPIDLAELVRDVEQMVETSLGKTVRLEVEVEPGLWPILGDAAQIEQAVVNLLLNGRDAMPEGGQLELSVRNLPADGPGGLGGTDHVELRVADEGVGIAAADRERIFEPFWTTKSTGGSGLGLAVVYGVAQGHAGRLEVDSEVGQGTTFRWLFPRQA